MSDPYLPPDFQGMYDPAEIADDELSTPSHWDMHFDVLESEDGEDGQIPQDE